MTFTFEIESAGKPGSVQTIKVGAYNRREAEMEAASYASKHLGPGKYHLTLKEPQNLTQSA